MPVPQVSNNREMFVKAGTFAQRQFYFILSLAINLSPHKLYKSHQVPSSNKRKK